MPRLHQLAFAIAAACAVSVPASADFTMEQVLHYPFTEGLASADHADRIAWVRNVAGVRNVWVADGPTFKPRQVTSYTADDGQEITQLTFSPDGSRLLYVRGGDHFSGWPTANPASSPDEPKVTIWNASLNGDAPTKIAEGDAPAISAKGVLAYVKDDEVWTASLDGKGEPKRFFFDRGKHADLRWSPDGSKLAFVSDRGDHAFIGVFESKDKPVLYLAPSTSEDSSPRWSPDGTRIAFVRQPGQGGPPVPLLKQVIQPWSIWIADAASGAGHVVWQSPNTMDGSYPDIAGEANLHWMAGERLVFTAALDGWPHLYSISADGGQPLLLTPGPFMIGHLAESRDHRSMIYDANTGTTPGDFDRRHVFRVPVDRAEPVMLTSGTTLEWSPVAAGDDRVAFVTASAQEPPLVGAVSIDGSQRANLEPDAVPADFPLSQLVTPTPVTFKAADGVTVHGELFQTSAGGAPEPAIVYLRGGPEGQTLLGWHYVDGYSNDYAVNQYFVAHGFVVLTVNYRGGIGYGRAFEQPDHAGYAGASEYQDVVAGARFLQNLPGVDPKRIGVRGESYGGYLAALALARNSDIFKAGVDIVGFSDFSRLLAAYTGSAKIDRFEQGDRDAAMKLAWQSSPDSSIDGWKSPVLLIHGDDDHSVPFQQTIDLSRRLDARHLYYEELVIPDEIHDFRRYQTWLKAGEAGFEFLARKLGAKPD